MSSESFEFGLRSQGGGAALPEPQLQRGSQLLWDWFYQEYQKMAVADPRFSQALRYYLRLQDPLVPQWDRQHLRMRLPFRDSSGALTTSMNATVHVLNKLIHDHGEPLLAQLARHGIKLEATSASNTEGFDCFLLFRGGIAVMRKPGSKVLLDADPAPRAASQPLHIAVNDLPLGEKQPLMTLWNRQACMCPVCQRAKAS